MESEKLLASCRNRIVVLEADNAVALDSLSKSLRDLCSSKELNEAQEQRLVHLEGIIESLWVDAAGESKLNPNL